MAFAGRIEKLLRMGALICVAFFAITILVTPDTAHAKYASFVIDTQTGRILHQINADTRNYPASLTKMMTLYMIFDGLETGKLKLNKSLKVSARAARQPSSKLGLRKGQKLTVKQAILALVTKSANDVATAVAENLAGSERNFALAMTAKARKIGMNRTNFRNASGLPNRGQLSTARDMATLARRLMEDFPQYYHYFSTKTFSYGGKKHKNHNELLRSYHGADGIKTGYIRASGFNLVASVERDGRRIIGVVFGGDSSRSRNRHMAKLLDKGFAKINPALVKTAATTKTAKKKKARADSKQQWGVQVGAYLSPKPARAIAEKAIAKAPDYLIDGFVKVVPLKKGVKKPVYRARILGLTKRQAYRACRTLKRRKINCMELRVKEPMQLASAQ